MDLEITGYKESYVGLSQVATAEIPELSLHGSCPSSNALTGTLELRKEHKLQKGASGVTCKHSTDGR